MNTPLYHDILNKRRESIQDGCINHIFNGIIVDNPLTALDCSPDTGFENFEHMVRGDRLVYAELANSTPFEGHMVKNEFKPLVRMNARTSCVFAMTDIQRMRRRVIGTNVVRRHVFYAFYKENKDNILGTVVDASVFTEKWFGEKYKTLCVLCWIDGQYVDKRMNNGLLYLSFGMKLSNETCCLCGKSSTVSSPCNHINDDSAQSPFSICVFKHFNGIELVNEGNG